MSEQAGFRPTAESMISGMDEIKLSKRVRKLEKRSKDQAVLLLVTFGAMLSLVYYLRRKEILPDGWLLEAWKT